jgi:hypothetical protein
MKYIIDPTKLQIELLLRTNMEYQTKLDSPRLSQIIGVRR